MVNPTLTNVVNRCIAEGSPVIAGIPHDRPLAAAPFKSYRYRGRYGFVMIGAMDNVEALYEAGRSTGAHCKIENLEVWNGTKYVPAE